MKIEGFEQMLEQIQRERAIPKDALVSAICAALLSAYKRTAKVEENLEATIDQTGVAKIFSVKEVVSTVEDPTLQISAKEAKKLDPNAKKGDTLKIDVTPHDFGRFAAQTAKQVIIQRIREAEKDGAFDEYTKRIGDVINGTVQKKERNGYLINLGRAESILPNSELVPGENYRPKERIKVFIVDVKKSSKGPEVLISRSHSGLVKKLFEMEIPEIPQGILEIKNIAREAGRRTKVAVFSNDKNIAAVGTCVGQMGGRIQNIVKELGTERVDIVEWNESPVKFISNALSPAKVSKVVILSETEKIAKVIVPENQLSLAIGKEGQNVRLAAKLTGWKIDIASEEATKAAEEEEKTKSKKKEAGEKKEAAAESPAKAVKAKATDKAKVHEIAKELGKKSDEILIALGELGIEAKGPTSSVSLEDKQKVIDKLKE